MADVTVTSADDYIVVIDCDNNNTDRVFKITHDNGTELFRVQEDSKVGIATSSPSALLEIVASGDNLRLTTSGADQYPALAIYTEGNRRWDIYNNQADDALNFMYDETVRFWFNQDGSGYADDSWNTFSPDITKDEGIKSPSPDDYLNWALKDAKKPCKPYKGPYDPVTNFKIPKNYQICSKDEEMKKYAKGLGKMAIGTARWAEQAREEIKKLKETINVLQEKIK